MMHQEGRSATIEVGVPGHVKIHAVAIARSAAEAEHFQRLAEQLKDGDHRTIESGTFVKFENGALELGFEIETDDHIEHVAAEQAANEPLPPEDQDALKALSGSGGLAAGPLQPVPVSPSGSGDSQSPSGPQPEAPSSSEQFQSMQKAADTIAAQAADLEAQHPDATVVSIGVGKSDPTPAPVDATGTTSPSEPTGGSPDPTTDPAPAA